MHGKNKTTPIGIDIFELPFSFILRRKRANRGEIRSRCREKSPSDGNFSREGRFGEEGIRFARFCTSPIECEIEEVATRGLKEVLRRQVE